MYLVISTVAASDCPIRTLCMHEPEAIKVELYKAANTPFLFKETSGVSVDVVSTVFSIRIRDISSVTFLITASLLMFVDQILPMFHNLSARFSRH